MGYTNGTKSTNESEKGEKGDKGVGFSLTADEHYHLNDKRLTNVSTPIDNSDATTKKFVTDLLKTKAGTTYVNNELAKKASQTNVNTALDLKADKFQLTTLNNKLTTLDANKTNNTDFIAFSQNIAAQLNGKADTNIVNILVFPKPKVSINAEENGNTTYDAYEWSFGNGGESNKY